MGDSHRVLRYVILVAFSALLADYSQDRAHAFSVAIREWRHLKSLKRAGRGHDPSGVNGTREGQLAVPCRACPAPSTNLPADWENVAKAVS